MAKSVTLADIAAAAGVSGVAVHKALNDKPGVSDELRKKIKELAQAMGYISAGSAKKADSAQRTGNVGVIIPEQYYGYSVSFYGQLYERVVKTLFSNDYYGILELLTSADEKAVRFPKVMLEHKVDGLVLLGQVEEQYAKAMMHQNQLPIIFLDSCIPGLTFDTVISDGYYGTYQLTNFLIENGHRKIGFVGSVDVTSSIADRYWGYRRALRENRITFQDAWEIPDRNERFALETIVEDSRGLDAFVCNCDISANTLIQNLEAKGIRVPEDVSVVGFDDFLPLGMDNSRITSYRVEMDVMARRCVKTLLKKIRGEKYAKGIQVVTGEIVHKKTVAARKTSEEPESNID